ncbi:MAG TPA: electron transport complex subunit RsxE [Lentisphaeria bacterium]|nr:electron transport complex subunit RsxE [Lentisphaeria bacterium]
MKDPRIPDPLSWSVFTQGIWRDNPVFVMLLGLCPLLAVTNTAMNALAMGLATTFVLVCSGTLVSLLQRVIPKQVRIAAYIIIIATFVTIVDYAIQAISLDLHKALGAFIQLIVVNCVILGRAEAYASKNPVVNAIVNAFGMGVGFTLALLSLGIVREIIGSGSLFGIDLFGAQFQPWAVFVLPPGGFFVLAFWLFVFSLMRKRKETRAKQEEVARAA